jgi:hypothetical protein
MSKEILNLYKANNLLKAKEEIFDKLAMISNIAMDAAKVSMAKDMFNGKNDVAESTIEFPQIVELNNNRDIVPLSEGKKTTTITIDNLEKRKDKDKIDDILQDFDHDIDGDVITLNIPDMSRFRSELKRNGIRL